MTLPSRLKFGVFMAPFHWEMENPTYSLERDLELLQWLDHLDFDEAWIGEHHSAGWEIIASPEVFIATAAGLYSKLCRYKTPRMKSGCAARAPELRKSTMSRKLNSTNWRLDIPFLTLDACRLLFRVIGSLLTG